MLMASATAVPSIPAPLVLAMGFSFLGALGAAMVYLLHLRKMKERSKRHYSAVVQEFEEDARHLRVSLQDSEHKLARLQLEREELELRAREREREAREARLQNPAFKRLLYNVAVIGISGCGKTALISKLVEPRFSNLPGLTPTTMDQQDRTVIVELDMKRYVRTEHALRFYEWGGEHLIKSQNDMLSLCRPDFRLDENGLFRNAGVQAMIFVVDVAFPGAMSNSANPNQHEFSMERIHRQVSQYFSGPAIHFLLNDNILPYLQLVVLFINKIDSMSGQNHSEIEEAAVNHYRNLVRELRKQAPRLEVIVGSAYTEAGLHRLFSTLATGILPQSAWGGSLRATDRVNGLAASPSDREAPTNIEDISLPVATDVDAERSESGISAMEFPTA